MTIVPGFPRLALVLALVACGDALAPEVAPESAAAPVREFVDLMNAHRASVGCAPLVWHDGTARVAKRHSEDMVERSFFDHTNPDGESPFDRLRNAGITWTRAGENIAAGYADAAAVLQGWLASPGHRANIENCAYTHHGVGLDHAHWTHLFVTDPRD
jgi:uncharacterized protein YkwD